MPQRLETGFGVAPGEYHQRRRAGKNNGRPARNIPLLMIGKLIAVLFFGAILAFAAVGMLAMYLAANPRKRKDLDDTE